MSFKLLVAIGTVLIIAATVVSLPAILRGVKTNVEIEEMLQHPNATFNFFNKCKKQVSDVNRCYNAYSAAVQIANSKNCTQSGIELKRKFKRLVEHSTNRDIEDEIDKECALK